MRCASLAGIPGLVHAFSTREADRSDDFDLGEADRSEIVDERRRRFLAAAGFGRARPAVARQVHGSRIVRVVDGASPEADGFVWDGERTVAACVLTADCVPILIADRDGSRAAAVHAGWRGTAAGIATEAVAALAALGSPPSRLAVALGPAILRCCYEVGSEVVHAVASRSGGRDVLAEADAGGERYRLDLHVANRRQLIAAGVPAAAIDPAPWCTRCHAELFFSFRRGGASAGRHMAAIGWGRRP